MSLSVTLKHRIIISDTGTPDISTPSDPVDKDLGDTLANGTGLDQADKKFAKTYTITTGSNQDLDLAGVLVNPFGGTVTFARIKGIIIKLTTLTAGYYVNVGGGDNGSGQNAFINWVNDSTDKIRVRAGGHFELWAPDVTAYAVTAGTGDILRVNNPNAASVTVEVILIGASA